MGPRFKKCVIKHIAKRVAKRVVKRVAKRVAKRIVKRVAKRVVKCVSSVTRVLPRFIIVYQETCGHLSSQICRTKSSLFIIA